MNLKTYVEKVVAEVKAGAATAGNRQEDVVKIDFDLAVVPAAGQIEVKHVSTSYHDAFRVRFSVSVQVPAKQD